MIRPFRGPLLALAAALPFALPLAAQGGKERAAPALLVASLAGQPIPLLPVTFVSVDSGSAEGVPEALAARLAWADSVVAEQFQARAPEVTWLLPGELRRVHRRAPATVTDPDRMGQAVLRSDGFRKLPDPLFSYLRSLAAMTNARQVMVPAAVRLVVTPAGVRAETVLVLADARSGAILWRSRPSATAATAGAALAATIAHVLPDLR